MKSYRSISVALTGGNEDPEHGEFLDFFPFNCWRLCPLQPVGTNSSFYASKYICVRCCSCCMCFFSQPNFVFVFIFNTCNEARIKRELSRSENQHASYTCKLPAPRKVLVVLTAPTNGNICRDRHRELKLAMAVLGASLEDTEGPGCLIGVPCGFRTC